ncbi:5,6-dimethylbenzimidazole synthase [Poseidonibacter lekithochrous]|uniref:5,6-dimethylbenzimidazole synthase n=1 Tax=Poseidonibacter TaxID=2321187 RepID=UPI001C082922|nr:MULTISPECIES: 5,6-dimethylbenzimidazole synthase [Poseidonibacter]MBU3014300.1 5,6-dimethylbenzimidazole synthase [Poseidonibacter lekithochrous]MDO6827598.1 5,6-dimethylbenzimidazole synthase [Poseidonibacter sp. 1_MG-2023]
MIFKKKDQTTLNKIITSRRDVRGNNFINKKISQKKLLKILNSAQNAPSVGYSQPWRFVIVDEEKKELVYKHFKKSYDKSKVKFKDRKIYNSLKLEGIKESNINIAVYYKKSKKDILGQTYMKRTGEYSVVCAILNMWLTARALNIGMGWVSILKPKKINKIFDMKKEEHKFIAYLCFGYTKEFFDEPELKKLGWKKKKKLSKLILKKEENEENN